MRNIALLEWGPASLYHIKPRVRIKVRTPWLDDGPLLPTWLATTQQVQDEGFCVRYALSAYEDLNGAIRNLRQCFGFPYQEYIGYLNTLSRTHRARREHEGLIDRLRRWAILGNVDAVLWIDYSKANQPPGSFKNGPKDSRPFSPSHIQYVVSVVVDDDYYDFGGNAESEGAWSESDMEFSLGFRPGGNAEKTPATPSKSLAEKPVRLSLTDAAAKTQVATGRQLPSPRPTPRLTMLEQLTQSQVLTATPRERSQQGGSTSSRSHNHSTSTREQDSVTLRTMLQEEFVPAHGSIYVRSMAPGPGYYGVPSQDELLDESKGCGFGTKPRGRIDETVAREKDKPGPGQYATKPALTDVRVQGGRFDQAIKVVSPLDAPRKLPFISALAATTENHSIFSPNEFHGVTPEAVSLSKGVHRAPKYSFGKMRRPF
mmetsp:Transcript_66797/g.159837  ORF Transcript_66797/g.159837 Transcript_66797/m.159837 type:complete len:429 (-) Transcript_66797:164-1450(-)